MFGKKEFAIVSNLRFFSSEVKHEKFYNLRMKLLRKGHSHKATNVVK